MGRYSMRFYARGARGVGLGDMPSKPRSFTRGGVRGATLPERRQSPCAMKPQAQRVDDENSGAKVKHRTEREHDNERSYSGAFAPPGHTPIDSQCRVYLVV